MSEVFDKKSHNQLREAPRDNQQLRLGLCPYRLDTGKEPEINGAILPSFFTKNIFTST